MGDLAERGIAVPLSTSAKEPELEHILTDAEVALVLVSEELKGRMEPLCRRLGIDLVTVDVVLGERHESNPALKADLEEDEHPKGSHLPRLTLARRAMMLYTSGTTSKPKGVVSTHRQIEAQIRSLMEAWGWRNPMIEYPFSFPFTTSMES